MLDEIYEHLDGAQNYGRYLAAPCPFHDDSRPSFMVYEDYYRCESCGAFGRTEQLLAKLTNNPSAYIQQVAPFRNPFTKWLRKGDLQKVMTTAWKTLCQFPHFGTYLKRRGIKSKHIRKLGIGAKDNWFTFPIKDQDNKIIGAVARAGEDNNSQAKYVTPSGQDANLLYVPSWKRVNKATELYLTFGIIDAVSFWQIGKASASTLSGKRIDPSALDWCRKRIIVVPDWGEFEEAHQLASRLGWRGSVLELDYPDRMKDANDLYINNLLHV